ncbi:MAG: HD domain-containing protein [Gemmataceae bacterium]
MPKPLAKLSALEPGQHADFFARLAEKTPRATRDGKPFYVVRLRDPRRSVGVTVWADSPHFDECKEHWQPGMFFKVRGRYVEDEKYGPKVEVEQIRAVTDRDRADGFAEADFADPPPADGPFAELTALAADLADEPLRTLVQNIRAAHADRLKVLPGSARTYYPFAGGWAVHTRNVARHALWLAGRYAELFPDVTLNRDLVLAGALLHDVGRVAELDPTSPVPRAGVDGELFGHLLLGVELVREAARGVPDLNPELLRLLGHVIYSHLKTPEWGSPRLPAIPEVLIVHHADDLDAKFEMFARCLSAPGGDGPFTARDPVLGRPLLKGRTV